MAASDSTKKKDYYQKNSERIKANVKAYSLANKSKIKKRGALYRAKNKEKIRLKKAAYNAANQRSVKKGIKSGSPKTKTSPRLPTPNAIRR